MHILYLHQYFCPPGGSGNNRSLEMARAWVRAGHKVTFVTSAAYFPDSARRDAPHWHFQLEGMQVHVLNVPYAHMMPFRQRMRAWIRFYRKAMAYTKNLKGFDLIYASSTPLTVGEMGRKLARRWQIPWVFETVDVWPDVPAGMGVVKNRLLLNWLNRRTNKLYSEAAAIIALSEGMRTQVLSHGVAPEKVHVIHNGCDPGAFGYVERQPKAVVKAIYTGTVGIANGVEQIVEAAAEIWKMGRRDLQFTVLGRGNALEKVKAMAAAHEVPNLEFRDRVPKEEVAGLLADADIGLVCFAPYPVLEANSANKFYDYLATGLPVVLNYEGWQADYLRQYGCGMYGRQGDGQAFVRNILKLADTPALRMEMGRRGRSLVEEKFDRRKLALKVLEIFEAALISH